MKLSDYVFELPQERIAQEPCEPRDAARLLVHEIAGGATRHVRVSDLVSELRAGDLLVVNDTRVLPARIWARRETGGRVELLLLEPVSEGSGSAWRAMVRPAKKPKPGDFLAVLGADGEPSGARAEMLERELDEDGQPGALWRVRLHGARGEESVESLLEQNGEMPLPPYIERPAGGRSEDRERYQTVYAQTSGAVAAPTAGLHFTPELLAALEARGVERTQVTLHVGLGTFLPVQVEDVDEHRMHAERFEVSQACVEAVSACKARGGRVVAVGTTSVRALESSLDENGQLRAGRGSTQLFLRPGRPLRCVDALMTNFHLPGSTLLMLVSALVGRERLLELYGEAIRQEYRFYSYGDAMLLLP
ncbi:MAG: S-adenosylmethionine:tRNA ribosyltransferase-isomerase [Planctomycetota bacterium]|jgi:S-adenosylmethionine:tRNA ribosyltransferase-isomerase